MKPLGRIRQLSPNSGHLLSQNSDLDIRAALGTGTRVTFLGQMSKGTITTSGYASSGVTIRQQRQKPPRAVYSQ